MRRWSSLRLALVTLLAALALSGLSAVTATAAGNSADAQCSSGSLTGHYTIEQLRQALGALTAEQKEYSNCPDVINRALAAALAHPTSGSGTGGGSGGSFLPTPVIVILVVLLLAAITFGALAVRRRRPGLRDDLRAGAAAHDDPPI